LDLLTVDEYITLPEEIIVDSKDNILESIIKRYAVDETKQEPESIEVEKISNNDAIKALELLKLYEIQQTDRTTTTIQRLKKMAINVNQRRQEGLKQARIKAFLVTRQPEN
jgi:hypothetical protein